MEIFLEAPGVGREARHGNHTCPEACEVGHCEVQRRRVHQEAGGPLDKAQVVEEVGRQRVGSAQHGGVGESINFSSGIIEKRERCLGRASFGPEVDGLEEATGSVHGGGLETALGSSRVAMRLVCCSISVDSLWGLLL